MAPTECCFLLCYTFLYFQNFLKESCRWFCNLKMSSKVFKNFIHAKTDSKMLANGTESLFWITFCTLILESSEAELSVKVQSMPNLRAWI